MSAYWFTKAGGDAYFGNVEEVTHHDARKLFTDHLLKVRSEPTARVGARKTRVADLPADKVRGEDLEAWLDFLSAKGWPLPLLADSGNGFHLLYRIDLEVDDGGLIQRVLRALDERFSGAVERRAGQR